MYENFTNLYSLSKTISFRLEPQGETLAHIEANGILEEDMVRVDEAKKVKSLANEYHKAFIERTLGELELEGVEAYEYAFFNKDDSENGDKILEKCALELRNQVAAAFRKAPGFKDMFSGKMFSDVLPGYYAGSSDALAMLRHFDKFTTYFRKYNDVRKLLYDASDDKGRPKSGTVARRVIDENLPVYLVNSRKLGQALAVLTDTGSAQDELDVFLHGESFEEFFSPASYSHYLTQSGIDRYNQVIGGYAKEDGTKVKGLNEYINLYNQKVAREDRLHYLAGLRKMILSDRTTLSFIPDKFTGDDELTDALREFDSAVSGPIKALASLVKDISKYDAGSIYISTASLRNISNKVFGSWHFIDDLLSDKYDRESPATEKKKKTKTYLKKKKKELSSVKAYPLGVLDSIPGIDGGIARYLVGASDFGASGIGFARKDLMKRLDRLADGDEKSLKRNEPAKADIKGYLDACLDFRNLLKAFYMDDPNRDPLFYSALEENLETVGAVSKFYDKVRNYLSGKLYTNEKVKLNFGAADFLGGWAESTEKAKRGTILMRGGDYFLGIIADGQGDLFAGIPDAKTDDIYMKMRYNQIAQPSKDLPRIVFADCNEDLLKPSSEILGIYEKKSYLAGSTFSIDDCHKMIDFYKSCLETYPNWQIYDFRHLKETGAYAGIKSFCDDVKYDAYDVRFRKIDREAVDRLVKEGRLYLFKISCRDFSEHAHGKPNLFTLYWKALFDEDNLRTKQFRLAGGAEMFYRKASIKESEIIRHRKGDTVRAKNPLTKNQTRVLEYDIIKDRRFTLDHFSLNVPIKINATSPDLAFFLNTDARFAIKRAADPHVIGVSRGENSLIHITVLDSKGNVVESRSLNVIDSGNGSKTDYARLLAEREAERDAQRKSWSTMSGIKNLKEGYISTVVHILTELMIKYDAVIAIEDMNSKFKQSRQKIEKAVYQQLEEKLIRKLNFLTLKDAAEGEPGCVYRGYQLTLPFQSFEKIGLQTGFIFYVSPWNTTAIDPATGYTCLFDTRYTNREKARKFWSSFDRICYDEEQECYRFDFDYMKFLEGERAELVKGTKTNWSIYAKGEKFSSVRTDKGVSRVVVDIAEAVNGLFARYDIGSGDDLVNEIASVNDKEFHEELLRLFGIAAGLRSGIEIKSCVMDDKGRFYTGSADANGSYNIARKGLILVNRLRNASDEELAARGKDSVSMYVSGNEWLRYCQE